MKKICLGLILFLFLFFSSGSSAQTILTFTTGDDQRHGRAKAMNAVLTECFNRIGIRLNITPMPSKRSLINADRGIEDGNFLRTDTLSYAFPNLVIVPERLSVNRVVAFSKNEKIEINDWKSLFQYHVAYVNGWKNCERELKDHNAKTAVKNEYLLFTLLEKNRADVGIFGLSTGTEVLNKLGYNRIKAIEPPIVTNDLFLYVNKKHAALIPKIVKTLQSIKQDGTYRNIVNQYHTDRPEN
ncbi:substrate-binding periplasmic protein [Desulfosarcina alkanivorans]|uniref:substrate-binding periplasmic protein n=1 Tax=Desulfosarcina alkanivorans TaxID=571177 RepID=UPI0012D2C586|nr:transporter substrate-binding domain-containing protein [Desulfosarcina alkanivorans]